MYKRSIEEQIIEKLNTQKILLLIWARQVWKTTLLRKYYEQYKKQFPSFFINLENPQYLELLNNSPTNIFQLIWPISSYTYLFIDEIQKLHDPSTFLKYLYDEYHTTLKIVATWSSAFYMNEKFTDSLAWRKHLLELHSLSLQEYLIFKDLEELASATSQQTPLPLLYRDELLRHINDYIVYGWYPEVVLCKTYKDKKELLKELTSSYIKKDILDAWLQYQNQYSILLQLLASQVWSLVNYSELANQLSGITTPTVKDYIFVMRSSFHAALITPYYRNKRKELSKMPKVYFYDTWIRNALLDSFDPYIQRSSSEKWALLENFVFKRLLDSHPVESIHFWRDKSWKEVDFIIGSQAWEVKSSVKKQSITKYKLFQERYPDIVFNFIDLEWAVEL